MRAQESVGVRVEHEFVRTPADLRHLAAVPAGRVTVNCKSHSLIRRGLLHRQRQATILLWGEAGRFAVETFDRLNDLYFDGELPQLPIVIDLPAYGKCLGSTLPRWTGGKYPRIQLAPGIFRDPKTGGIHVVEGVMTHEMLHAKLILEGRDPKHNGTPWVEEIVRLSPAVLGFEIQAERVKTRRIPKAERQEGDPAFVKGRDGFLDQGTISRWPGSLRPPDFDRGELIYVEAY